MSEVQSCFRLIYLVTMRLTMQDDLLIIKLHHNFDNNQKQLHFYFNLKFLFQKEGNCAHILLLSMKNDVNLPSHLPKLRIMYPNRALKIQIGRSAKNTPALNMS